MFSRGYAFCRKRQRAMGAGGRVRALLNVVIRHSSWYLAENTSNSLRFAYRRDPLGYIRTRCPLKRPTPHEYAGVTVSARNYNVSARVCTLYLQI